MSDTTDTTANDPTGELATTKAMDDFKAKLDALLKEAFENKDLTRDPDIIDILTDEAHEKIDEYLTNFYNTEDADLQVDDIDGEVD